MRDTGKRLLSQTSGKSSIPKGENEPRRNPTPLNKSSHMIYTKRYKSKPRSHVKTIGSLQSKRRASSFSSNANKNNSLNGKGLRTLQKVPSNCSSKKQSSLKLQGGKLFSLSCKRNGESADSEGGNQGVKKRRKRKRKKENIVGDEASRLQRRARYLMIKMKLEQSLIDAYNGEGWKGQSREKIKPEKELQRAEKQILECKLGIRDVIHQLELLSSEGRIEDSVIDPDGRVFHEHIFCAKCKLREAFPDNDIILCDGTCNCAFHQKCLDPPLATENIPPGDQGWFCKFCEHKMDILEQINAHLGTRFSVNSDWQDVFKEAATAPTEESKPAEDWPSDDSEDEDYDPEKNDKICTKTDAEESISDGASYSSGVVCSSDEACSLREESLEDDINGGYHQAKKWGRDHDKTNVVDSTFVLDSDDMDYHEIINFRRQRKDVDYKKLHDEMFGKDLLENEQNSEDEDWGPDRRKRRVKESNEDTALATNANEDGRLNMDSSVEENNKQPSISHDKKPLFRIPSSAVEKLRRVFAENELPSRDVKENLSKELGIASEKINKWFKNARYLALKNRKSTEQFSNNNATQGSNTKLGKISKSDKAMLNARSHLAPLAVANHVLKISRRVRGIKSIPTPSKQHKVAIGAVPTNAIKVNAWLDNAHQPRLKKRVRSSKRVTSSEAKTVLASEMNKTEELYMVQLERLFALEDRLEKLKKELKTYTQNKHVPKELRTEESAPGEHFIVYVPVAELREKM